MTERGPGSGFARPPVHEWGARFALPEERLVDLRPIQDLLPRVRSYVREHLPPDWPQLATALHGIVEAPLGPLATLPLAGCAAAGGDPVQAVPASAAWVAFNVAMRVLDDVEDQDRPTALWTEIGVPRAVNYGVAAYMLGHELLARAPWPATRYREIGRAFLHASLQIAAGQDRDLRAPPGTLDEYWQAIEARNAYSVACLAGALCATEDATILAACRRFGHHAGLALQILDDLEGIWHPLGQGDLAMGKVTLPVVYGLSIEHPRRDELAAVVNRGRLAAEAPRVREILDGIAARDFLIWAALQERARALSALASCPGQTGVTALTAFITVVFGGLDGGGS
ncbi:MAG TPA: polyprenyl synthetase family protein [Thermomicrobiales bacterium]|jgi:geranylgeranyl diphosphate synthase type I